MARKRGGLAGLWDRNKGVIKTLAPIAAGVVGGPWAGAALGAAMRGLDRPGKSGIGFDVGEGIKGGIAGYGQGAMGKSIGAGLKGMFVPKAPAEIPAPDMSKYAGKLTPGTPGADRMVAQTITPDRTMNMGRLPMMDTDVSPISGGNLPQDVGSAKRLRDLLMSKEGVSGLGQFASAGANIIGSQRQAALEEERLRREEEQARARAEMMAMFAPSILESFNTMPRGR